MILFIIFDRAARSLTWGRLSFVLLVLAIPVKVTTQCPECNGQYIKTVNTTTGECISCFPCLRSCDSGYTSSVACGTTVPFGTDIKCVLLIPSDPVVLPEASMHTQRLNSLPLAISSKFIVAPATSTVHPTTSSSASTRSSIKGTDRSDTTKKQKSEKELALAEWKKDSRIYIFGGIFLAVALVAVVYKIRRNSRKQVSLQPQDCVKPDPSSQMQPLPDVLPQDNETCSINCTTATVEFRRNNGCTSEIGDGNQRSQGFAAQGSSEGKCKSSDLVVAPVDDVQLPTRALPPIPLPQSLIVQNGAIADGLEQGRRIIWSALSQTQKYNTKVLEIPLPLLYKICLTLDIPRADGNDVRMLAYKLGISHPELAILKQAAITQQPDSNYFNSTSCAVLTTNHSLSLKGFVDIMEGIQRDDIICLINNWSN